MNQSPYDILGVSRDASPEAVRAAYRRLARELHPDVNPGDPEAEERFKNVSHAYSILSDQEKRSLYDEFGEASLASGFDAQQARRARRGFDPGFQMGHAGEVPIDDLQGLFGGLFSGMRGTREPAPRGGPDLTAHIMLDFADAALGSEQSITLGRTGGNAPEERLTVQIPPGVSDGGRIRLRGKGGTGPSGLRGDLYLEVGVRPHRVFRREDRDLYLDLPVTVREAALGAKVELPTLEGRATVTLPAGTQSGRKLRLRGKGIPAAGRALAGDLIAVVQVRVPENLDTAGKAAIQALAAHESGDPRASLFD